MKKFILMATLVAVVVAALAIPALAKDRSLRGDHPRFEQRQDRFANFWDRFYDQTNWRDNRNATPVVSQNFNQQAQSGNVSQSFNVSSKGSNSNQCAGINGVANSGNAQNQQSFIQSGSEADDVVFYGSGASMNVGGNSTTNCSQLANQAAAAG